MPLEPVSATPGLWRAGDANEPGVHALIIGVSDYPYLSGGSAPKNAKARDNGGLGQLEVSAYAAALFFDWVVQAGEIAGAPLTSCRLHLAPRPDEVEKIKSLKNVGHYGDANYAALRTALDDWSAEMSVAGRTSQAPNVALFFYSGHGVEVAGSPAILASDVLNQLTADGGAGKAVAVDAMTTAVKTFNIDRGLFFIDACRDAPLAARVINLVGEQSLNPNRSPTRRPDALIRLHSTASGLKAYQLKDGKGTLFTEAVLDGLQGSPPQYLPYDTTNLPWPLRFAALEGHVKRRVNSLLADLSPLAVQSVEPYGNPYNGEMIVARKDGPAAGAGEVLATAAQALAPTIEAVNLSASNVLKNVKTLGISEIQSLRTAPTLRRGRGDLFNYGIMHGALGHETAANPWIDSLRFFDVETNSFASPDAAEVYNVHSQEVDGRIAAWIDLLVKPAFRSALWIVAKGRAGVPALAVAIPRDLYNHIPVRLDLVFTGNRSDWRLNQMSARIADPAGLVEPFASDQPVPEVWNGLFQAQRIEAFADLGSAAKEIADLQILDEALRQKRRSPIAAAFAANFLLRAGGLEHLHDWPKNLSDWFPEMADGAILWAETILRREGEDTGGEPVWQPLEALEYFLKISNRGVPLLSNTLHLAIRQAARWRPLLQLDSLHGADKQALGRAIGYIDRAAHYALSGPGFARFASSKPMLRPREVLNGEPLEVPRGGRSTETARGRPLPQ
jgi:hypothetical protein